MLKRSSRFYILVVLVALLITPVLINTDWEISHEIVIKAPPESVWPWLADLKTYPQWNRYSPNVTGTLEIGSVVWVEARLGNEVRHVKNRVLSVKPEQELCWFSDAWYSFLARGIRCRWLSQTAEGNTRLVHHEVMKGPLAWLIKLIYYDRIQAGIQMVDESLAEIAEKNAPTPLND
jgi:uncharacterized protein YndB with AHSA1/START domain